MLDESIDIVRGIFCYKETTVYYQYRISRLTGVHLVRIIREYIDLLQFVSSKTGKGMRVGSLAIDGYAFGWGEAAESLKEE